MFLKYLISALVNSTSFFNSSRSLPESMDSLATLIPSLKSLTLYSLFLAIRMVVGFERLLLIRASAVLAEFLERSTFFTKHNLLPYHFFTSLKQKRLWLVSIAF